MQIKGSGLRDLAVNFQYIFEITLPDEFDVSPRNDSVPASQPDSLDLLPPETDAPTVCVIDSGIQEGHRLLTPAIDGKSSRCFLPGFSVTDVADYVANGGHGTRVAGAVLFGENIPACGFFQLGIWLQNARVLDNQCKIPIDLLPAKYIREVVQHFLATEHHTRLYNHSITSRAPHRLGHMSAWAAEIDVLSYQQDVLFIQSAGNVPTYSYHPVLLGIGEHIAAGRSYPEYLLTPACRISNPAQSLQAITVGSIAYKEDYLLGNGTFACKDGPSSFSKTGYGLWSSIKPDVVEYGGELMHDASNPMQFFTQPDHCPDLVRSTLGAGGPEKDRDTIGTSFSSPKVAHLAAKLQGLLPEEPTLLYRALIAQSARWPFWAERASDRDDIVRHIGYGLPNEERATSNSPHRITLITTGTQQIRAGDAHLYDVPIPIQLREIGEDYDVRIEITLSYAARPKRTRRNHRNYLSTWLDWDTSGRNETPASFKRKIFKEEEKAEADKEGTIKWTIGKQKNTSSVRGTSRSFSTLQKDWAIVKPYDLPEIFSLAVVGHKGWDKDPDAFAKYALAISFEVPGQEITIYEEIRASVQQLIQSQVQAEVDVVSV